VQGRTILRFERSKTAPINFGAKTVFFKVKKAISNQKLTPAALRQSISKQKLASSK